MKTLFRVMSLIVVIGLTFSVVGSTSAANTWAVGNLVGLCAGTPIHSGSGDNYFVHTIVPEDNWTVKVIGGPRTVNGQVWWDTSRKAAGDPSGGTGWVKQSEADNCSSSGGGDNGGIGGGSGGDPGGGGVDPKYTNPFNDTMSNRPPWKQDLSTFPTMSILDGFQWPMASFTTGPFLFSSPDFRCPGVHHANDFIASQENAPVYAIGRGVVKTVREDIRQNDEGDTIGYGLYIIIWHKMPSGEDVYSLYSHLWPGTALVKENQIVERGDQIARQDTSGGANGTPHLHFEIRHPGDKTLFAIPGCPATTAEAYKYYYNPLEYIPLYWWESRPRMDLSLPKEAEMSASLVSDKVQVQEGNLNKDEEKGIFHFIVNAWDKLMTFVTTIGGSTVEVTLYKPDGSVYGVYQVSNPPYMVVVNDPEPGQWGYSIRAIDIPHDDYPYAVAIGTKASLFPDVSDNIGDNPFDGLEGDIMPPSTSISINPSSPNGKNGWYVSPISVTLSAADDPTGSGLLAIYYSLNDQHNYTIYTEPFIVNSEGVNTLKYYSIDKLGNFEELHTVEFKLDMTPPIVNTWTDQPEYTRVQPFVVHYSGYDPEPGSGLASLTGVFNGQPVVNGQTVDLFWLSLGQYNLNVTGEDYAGWTTTKGKSIQLVATIESLQQTVKRLCKEKYITKSGVCNSLQSKLNSALAAQKRGQKKTAVNILLAFQNEIKAQTGKAIQPKASALLVMDSNYVIRKLGGK